MLSSASGVVCLVERDRNRLTLQILMKTMSLIEVKEENAPDAGGKKTLRTKKREKEAKEEPPTEEVEVLLKPGETIPNKKGPISISVENKTELKEEKRHPGRSCWPKRRRES